MLNKLLKLVIFYFIGLFATVLRNFLILKDDNYYETENLDLENIQSGDIFMTSYTRKSEILGDCIFWINFKHISVVVFEGGKPFMVEYSNYPVDFKGLVKIPFSDWLKFNKKGRVLHQSLETTEMKRKELNSKILSYYEKNQKNMSDFKGELGLHWWKIFFPYLNKAGIDLKKPTCTEVMEDIFTKSGVIKSRKFIPMYTNHIFENLQGFHVNEDYKFNKKYICELKHLIEKHKK